MVNAQDWLEQNYPKEGTCIRKTEDKKGEGEGWNNFSKTCDKITKLDISREHLEGSLDLSDFPNLRILWCQKNEITELDVSCCLNLKILVCWKNSLVSLDVSQNKQLIVLFCSENQLTALDLENNSALQKVHVKGNKIKSDLNIFSHLTNLEELRLGESEEIRLELGNGNNNEFFGSLEPLKNLQNLRTLDIGCQSDIEKGLEHLPESVENFYCSDTDFEEILLLRWLWELSLEFEKKGYNYGQALKKWKVCFAQPELYRTEEEIIDEVEQWFLENLDEEDFFSIYPKKTLNLLKFSLLTSVLVNIVLILCAVWKKWKSSRRKKTTSELKK
jgi:hypothetical protein